MGDVAVSATHGSAAIQPPSDPEDFDFVKSVGETGYQDNQVEEESANDSQHGAETGALLAEMRSAITEQGLQGSEFKTPDLLRFLRARSNNVKKASKLFVDHENWRKTFCPKGYISEDEIRNELDAKKSAVGGRNKQGEPLAISLVKYHNASKRDIEEFKKLIVYALDKVVASMPPGVEKFVGFLDMTGMGYSSLDTPALRHIFDFLQGYYPERLSKLFFLNAPFIFGAVWKVVSPFVDARTRKKIVFCTSKNLADTFLPHFELDQVPTEFGGTGSLVLTQDWYVPGYPPDEEKRAKEGSASTSAAPSGA